MAPKKRLRGAGASAKAIVSGVNTQAIAKDLESVCPLMVATQRCVESMYALRHCKAGDVATETLAELPLDDAGGKYVWPVGEGGTFKDIAQRAWASPDLLLEASFEMVRAAGILDESSTVDTLKKKFCMVEDIGVNRGESLKILNVTTPWKVSMIDSV